MEKTVLIILDGVRSDALEMVNPGFLDTLRKTTRYTFNASSIVPPVTLPVITSMFLGTGPETHKVWTNDFTVEEDGRYSIFELIAENRGRTAFYGNWEELNRIAKPNQIARNVYVSDRAFGMKKCQEMLLEEALKQYENDEFDFTVEYFGEIDIVGHNHGWMSKEYLDAIKRAFDDVERIFQKLEGKYNIILATDHGGHAFNHGDDIPEDMRIPLFIYTPGIVPGVMEGHVSDLDIAPTLSRMLGLETPSHWEGKSLI